MFSNLLKSANHFMEPRAENYVGLFMVFLSTKTKIQISRGLIIKTHFNPKIKCWQIASQLLICILADPL